MKKRERRPKVNVINSDISQPTASAKFAFSRMNYLLWRRNSRESSWWGQKWGKMWQKELYQCRRFYLCCCSSLVPHLYPHRATASLNTPNLQYTRQVTLTSNSEHKKLLNVSTRTTLTRRPKSLPLTTEIQRFKERKNGNGERAASQE